MDIIPIYRYMWTQQNKIPQQLNVYLNTHPRKNIPSDGGCKDNSNNCICLGSWLYFKYDMGLERQNIVLYKTKYNVYTQLAIYIHTLCF